MPDEKKEPNAIGPTPGQHAPPVAGPPGTTPAPAAPPATPPAAPAAPFATFPDSASFDARVDREARKRMKERFGMTDEELEKKLAIAAKLEKEAEERRQAELTEQQRLQEEAAAAKAAQEAAIDAKEEAELKAHLFETFAKKRIANFDYAMFKVTSKLATLEEGEELDEDAYLAELLENPTERLALMGEPSKAPAKKEGATTTGTDPKDDPPAPPPGGGPPTKKSATDMTPDEFRKHLAGLGFHGGQVGGG